jgi:hypothetical protein
MSRKSARECPWPERDPDLIAAWEWRDAAGNYHKSLELCAILRLSKGTIIGRARRLGLPMRTKPGGRLGYTQSKPRRRPDDPPREPAIDPILSAEHDRRMAKTLIGIVTGPVKAHEPTIRGSLYARGFSMLGGTIAGFGSGRTGRPTEGKPPGC